VPNGKALVTRPFPSVALLPDEHGNLRAACPPCLPSPHPIGGGQIIAALGLRIGARQAYARHLATARAAG